MSHACFDYVAVERAGTRRKGVIRAADEPEAYRKLSASGLTPVRLQVARERTSHWAGSRIRKADVAALTRELNVLVRARIPIAQGLVSIAEHEPNPELRRLLHLLATSIESGSSITEALSRHRTVFGSVYIETMRAAEASGNLASVTEHLAEMLDTQIESAQQLRRALTYPVIVIGSVLLALGVILTFVVPKFQRMFASNKMELPLATQVVQALGRFSAQWWWAMLLGAGAGALALRLWVKTQNGRAAAEELLLRAPYLKRVVMSTTAARFGRVLGIGLGSGLSIIESILISGHATGRPLFAKECERMAESLRQGDRLLDVLRTSRYLPPFARRMLGAGRDSSELAEASKVVAGHYERDASHLTKNVSSVIEPVLTILLAVVVLVVALAVFLPMWQMVSVKGH